MGRVHLCVVPQSLGLVTFRNRRIREFMSYHSNTNCSHGHGSTNAHSTTLTFPKVRSVCLQCPTMCVHTFRASRKKSGLHGFGRPLQGAGAECIYLTYIFNKVESNGSR